MVPGFSKRYRLADRSLGWAETGMIDAVLVTTVAVAAQIAASPGGFGTTRLPQWLPMSLGYDPEPALVAALSAHGLKTAY